MTVSTGCPPSSTSSSATTSSLPGRSSASTPTPAAQEAMVADPAKPRAGAPDVRADARRPGAAAGPGARGYTSPQAATESNRDLNTTIKVDGYLPEETIAARIIGAAAWSAAQLAGCDALSARRSAATAGPARAAPTPLTTTSCRAWRVDVADRRAGRVACQVRAVTGRLLLRAGGRAGPGGRRPGRGATGPGWTATSACSTRPCQCRPTPAPGTSRPASSQPGARLGAPVPGAVCWRLVRLVTRGGHRAQPLSAEFRRKYSISWVGRPGCQPWLTPERRRRHRHSRGCRPGGSSARSG
jgi:hypothetical protein